MRELWLRRVGITLAVGAVVGGGMWFLRNQPQVASPVLPGDPPRLEPQIETAFDHVVLQGRDQGTLRWRIEADHVTSSQNQQFITFERNPHGVFFNLRDWKDRPEDEALRPPGATPEPVSPDRTRQVRWRSQRAEYDSMLEEMTMTGTASFTVPEGDRLVADRVVYRVRRHQMVAEPAMRLWTRDHMRLQAHRATVDTEIEQVELAGAVDLVAPLESGDRPW
ncbi:MAG: hypothetical protein VKP72_12955 [bacterium]|nr:hypothetical protein [bacterium]